MRIVLLILLLFVGSLRAHAQTVVTDPPACGKTAYGKIASGYIFTDNAVVATYEPVVQGGFTLTCGAWSYGLWSSYELSSKPYAERGYGDEWDFSVSYATTIESPLGPLALDASAAYWLVYRMGDLSDDVIALVAGVGRPINIGTSTLTPFARLTQWVGTGSFPETTLLRTGLRYVMPVTQTWRLEGSASYSWVATSEFYGTGEVTFGIAKSLPNGWSASGAIQAIEHTRSVLWLGTSKSW